MLCFKTESLSNLTGKALTDDDLYDLNKDGSYHPDKGTGSVIEHFPFFYTNYSRGTTKNYKKKIRALSYLRCLYHTTNKLRGNSQ